MATVFLLGSIKCLTSGKIKSTRTVKEISAILESCVEWDGRLSAFGSMKYNEISKNVFKKLKLQLSDISL